MQVSKTFPKQNLLYSDIKDKILNLLKFRNKLELGIKQNQMLF